MKPASPYPGLGSVFIIRSFTGRGPRGWHGNEHNDADGWYWCQATRITECDVVGPIMKRRKDVERDAERYFGNIVGWKSEQNGNYLTAVTS